DAVAALDRDLGYDPPAADPEKQSAEQAARSQVDSAESKLAEAKKALAEVRRGPKRSELLSARGQVDQARAQLRQARKATPRDEAAVEAAENQLAIAEAHLKELLDRYSGDAEQKAVSAAEEALEEARDALDDAAAAAATPLPQSELVVLRKLPRRADEVTAELGGSVSGSVMTVAGTEPEVVATVTAAEAELLKKGMKAVLELPDGTELAAEVTKIEN